MPLGIIHQIPAVEDDLEGDAIKTRVDASRGLLTYM